MISDDEIKRAAEKDAAGDVGMIGMIILAAFLGAVILLFKLVCWLIGPAE